MFLKVFQDVAPDPPSPLIPPFMNLQNSIRRPYLFEKVFLSPFSRIGPLPSKVPSSAPATHYFSDAEVCSFLAVAPGVADSSGEEAKILLERYCEWNEPPKKSLLTF